MENKFSRKTKELKPSATLLINKKVSEMKAKGEKILNLSVGEPDFDTPAFIKGAAIKAINEGFTKYTDSSGIKELREEISKKLFKDNNLLYYPEQIIVSNGAKHSLFNIFLAICDEGDEVIIPQPYWVSYPEMVKIAGGKPVFCRFNNEYKIDIEHLKSLINEKTKAIILNSPSNPSGIVYEKDELKTIGEIILRNNIFCISDEVYEYYIYDGKKHVSIASLNEELKNLAIVVNGVSKTFSMTGWRIGYLAAPLSLAKVIGNIQSQTTSNPSSISQKAALSALSFNLKDISPIIREF
ncbi:MAG: pyridoxal phosphate-dependent aminotransferase, partial [Candidatus Omnitrophica bacterium]|nr:pyridoxal phosphate-dependent aminotransferase [Candidatus Omnitrophota bacterium]